ncbi:MAG: DUF6597 domain-containing transcriptional factor [Cytophagaceae bacterium]
MTDSSDKSMHSKEFQPKSALLQKYIVSFWHLKTTLPEGMVLTSRDVPNGNIQLVLNLGDHYVGEKQDGKSKSLSRHILRGPQRAFNLVHKTGKINLFGATFKPSGLADFLDAPISDYTDKVEALENVFPEFAAIQVNELEEELLCERIEEFLLKHHKPKANTPTVELLIEKINETKGTVALKDISLPFKISLKHLERIFKNTTGLSPKQYAQQVRISHIIKEIHNGEDDLLLLATNYNFFDVAHLSKDFKTFTGLSPGKFSPHTITFNHSYNPE